jgi:hypothetical protein
VIRQLRDDGHVIDATPARTTHKALYAVYVLVHDAEATRDQKAAA